MAQAAGSSSSSSSANLCSICWEEVSDTCGRTVVRLQCSHLFHLDCIGSAFNATGIMQCPNCREIENGVWRLFDINEESDEDERNADEMMFQQHHGNHLCHGCGRAMELPLLGIQDLTELPPHFTGDSHLYGPSMMTGISTSPAVLHGHNPVHSAVPTPMCGHVVGPNHTLVSSRAPQCDADGLPNFESVSHRAIPQPGSRSNCWEGWHPAGHVPPPQQQQTVRSVPFFNSNIQNNPQEAGHGDNFLSLGLSTGDNPQAATPVHAHVEERVQTFQFLPDDMGPFRAPRD